MEKRREKVSRYELITGQDTYASQTSQNPLTSRRLVGFIPQPNGILMRQLGQAKFYPASINQPITNLIPFIYNNAGVFERHLFAKAQGVGQLEEFVAGWVSIPQASTFENPPVFASEQIMAAVVGGNLHLADGENNYLYDGGAKQIVNDGLPIPLFAPGSGLPGLSGNPVILTNRYYWTSWMDRTTTRPHESSVSPISAGTGPVTNQQIQVFQAPGTITVSNASTAVTGVNTTFTTLLKTFPNLQYAHFYVDGFDLGPIAAIVDNTHLTLLLPTPVQFTNVAYAIAPTRATHWNVYASESESSKVGLLLGVNALPVLRAGQITAVNGQSFAIATQPVFYMSDIGGHLFINNQLIGTIANISGFEPSATVGLVSAYTGPTITGIPVVSQISFLDNSSFFGVPGSTFQQINRPVRNDPPVVSSILSEHKYRLWRRRDTRPNFFSFSANEEVSATNNGSPYESNPGVDLNTESDLVNEDSYPDQSNEIRAMVSHADALYIFTELQAIPLYGETIDDFALSQVSAFNVGVAGSFAAVSTPHGLVFMSNDRKVYLYPTANYPWKYVPQDVNVTEQLMEIGLPLRTVFASIPLTALNNVRFYFYNYETRDWLIVAFTDKNNVVHNWIYDFMTKGWFELTPAYPNLAIYEFAQGQKVLLGGGTDGFIYVVDDLTGAYATLPPIPAGTVITPTNVPTSPPSLPAGNYYVRFSEFTDIGESYISIETGPFAVGAATTFSFAITGGEASAKKYRMYFGTTQGQENQYYEAASLNGTASFTLFANGTPFVGILPQTASLPAATFRPALIDFGDPDSKHVFRYMEFELTNPDLINDITVTYWLDPVDVDNPTTTKTPAKTLVMSKVRGANLYRGFPRGGSLCQRLLISIDINTNGDTGGFRGIKIVADKASALIF